MANLLTKDPNAIDPAYDPSMFVPNEMDMQPQEEMPGMNSVQQALRQHAPMDDYASALVGPNADPMNPHDPMADIRNKVVGQFGQGPDTVPIPDELKPKSLKTLLKNQLLGMIPFYGDAREQAQRQKEQAAAADYSQKKTLATLEYQERQKLLSPIVQDEMKRFGDHQGKIQTYNFIKQAHPGMSPAQMQQAFDQIFGIGASSKVTNIRLQSPGGQMIPAIQRSTGEVTFTGPNGQVMTEMPGQGVLANTMVLPETSSAELTKTETDTRPVSVKEFEYSQQFPEFEDFLKRDANRKNPTIKEPKSVQMMIPDGKGGYVMHSYREGDAVPSGALTSSGVSSDNRLSAGSKGMAEMAATLPPQIENLKSDIVRLAKSGKIGPAAGRWNNWWVNKAGMNDPDFAGLDMDLDLFASALVRTHFGARGGQGYREALKKSFSAAQSPQDLIARINHAETWIKGYADIGNARKDYDASKNKTAPSNLSGVSTDELFKRLTGGK